MPYLLISHSRHPLRPGRQFVAVTAESRQAMMTDDAAEAWLALDVAPDGTTHATRKSRGVDITVDGTPLGDGPAPLAHGAKLVLAGSRIIFGDDDAVGETDKRVGLTDEVVGALDEPHPAEPTADSGGRLIALSDGRTWDIPAEGLEIGRDPNCDVALRSPDASRWHASIAPTVLGYVLRETSTNGVFVNGRRIDDQRVLGRGDVIRIGDEEFRFEAAAAKYEPSTSLKLAAVGDESASAELTPPPAPPLRPAAPLLATLEILNPGILQGRRFRIEHPLTHVGRGAHNEIVLGDESVSGTHATIQRRANGWVVADQGSTNGTYVDGGRVEGESELRGACEIRFGGIKTLFRPLAGAGPESDSTRGIVGVVYGTGG